MSILAICGSTRESSSNLNLIRAIADLSTEIFEVNLFESLLNIPNFNPDNIDNPPMEVTDFKIQLREADGILICTPEYAAGVPGALKNAIDWMVATMEFSQKPVALITAATAGKNAHQSLLKTLLIIEARITKDSQLLISTVKTKINARNAIIHQETLTSVHKLIKAFTKIINRPQEQTYLPAPDLMNG